MKSTFTQRWLYFSASTEFSQACAACATRGLTLGQCGGEIARLNADAYLMGGEL